MSASTLTAEAQRLADEQEPVGLDGLALLRQPFPTTQIGKLPKGGTTLDYVGHGAVTDRLLDVDPEWTWEPMALDASGLPAFTYDANGNPIALWIRLTVCGITRLGCGTCRAGQFDTEKVLIGDAIRNAAMRFGVALDLWIRGQAEDDEKHASDNGDGPARRREPEFVWDAKAVQFALRELVGNREQAKRVWDEANGASFAPGPDAAAQILDAWEHLPAPGQKEAEG